MAQSKPKALTQSTHPKNVILAKAGIQLASHPILPPFHLSTETSAKVEGEINQPKLHPEN